MSKLNKGDFIHVTEGIYSGKILRFWFRKEGYYHYHLYDECNSQFCNLDKFSKIKLHRTKRKEYIQKYDTVFNSPNKDIDVSEKDEIKNKLNIIWKKTSKETKKHDSLERLRKEKEQEDEQKRKEKEQEDERKRKEKEQEDERKRKEKEDEEEQKRKEKEQEDERKRKEKEQEDERKRKEKEDEEERKRKEKEDEEERKRKEKEDEEERKRKEEEQENERKRKEEEQENERKRKEEEQENERKRKEEEEEDRRRKQLIQERIEKREQESREKREKFKTKEQILNNGFRNEIKINDFLLVVFLDNSYILLQCIDINNNNYYFLKLYVINKKVQYKDDEMNKIHQCNDTCINEMLSRSSIFNIYHDAALFENKVYSEIVMKNNTKNINPIFDKKNTPVIVVSKNSNSSNKVSENDKLTIVLKNKEILDTMSSSHKKSNKSNSSKKPKQNKSKKSQYIHINSKDVLPAYKNLKKVMKENLKYKLFGNLAYTFKNKKTDNKKTKKNLNPENSKAELQLLHDIPKNDRNVVNYKNNSNLKDNLKKGDYLYFKIYDKIYFLKYVEILNGNMYKFDQYYCENNECHKNTGDIIFLDEQLEHVIHKCKYIILYKELNNDDKEQLSVVVNKSNVNKINELKKQIIQAINESIRNQNKQDNK
jgi:hypothetical protein